VPEHHGRDGLALSYTELGAGRPLVLLHGFLGDGRQWLYQASAATFTDCGRRVILPDLRGHGRSARPHDPAAYPPGVLADDGLALLDHLGLRDGGYDLGGYSLGGRVVLRMLVRGARPGRAIVAGQGLDALKNATTRRDGYRRVLTALADGEPIDPANTRLAHWITESGGDPEALRNVLDTHVATPEEALRGITTPTLVAVGDQDTAHASADGLAAAIPGARFTRVPGDHFTAFTSRELTSVITAFLDGS
jgi:pimeloyl-ACP methyl ester carboxylesterase